jgi:hypothetical protein
MEGGGADDPVPHDLIAAYSQHEESRQDARRS